MPSYQGLPSKEDQRLLRFVRSSPFRPDPGPQVIDRAAIVVCDECGKRFLDSDWLGKHLADGHEPAGDPGQDLDAALSRAEGIPLSPYQVIATKILAEIRSGQLRPGSHLHLNEVSRRYGCTRDTASKAARVLVAHGLVNRGGYGRYTTWTIADHDGSANEDQG